MKKNLPPNGTPSASDLTPAQIEAICQDMENLGSGFFSFTTSDEIEMAVDLEVDEPEATPTRHDRLTFYLTWAAIAIISYCWAHYVLSWVFGWIWSQIKRVIFSEFILPTIWFGLLITGIYLAWDITRKKHDQ